MTPRRRRGRGVVARLLLVVVVAAVGVLSPATAWATFSRTAKATMTVGTATLSSPTSMGVTGMCPGRGSGYAKVTFSEADLADTYVVVLDPPKGSTMTTKTTSGSKGATFTLSYSGTYVVTVTSVLQGWTSEPLTRWFSC